MNHVTLVPACVLAAGLLCGPVARSATLQGSVRDSHDRPVAAAIVYLQGANKEQTLSAHTDSQGSYQFPELREGTYTLRAEIPGSGEAAFGPFVLGPKETKKVDLTLQPAFFDEPQFIVAGVTDATSRGGHGSDTVLRSAEALAKATASLSKEPPGGLPEKSLREAVARAPANAELHHSLAELDERQGNALEAANEYQRAAELQASERNLYDWAAELLTHRATEPAEEVFTKGHRLFPQSVRMLLGLAVAQYARGSYNRAARSFFEASDLNPGDPNPYLFLGKVQSVEITALEGFVEKMRRFASLEPDNAWANYYYAVSLWKRRTGPEDSATTAQVRSLLEKAVHLDPNLGTAYLQLGILYSDQTDFSKAISAYQKAIQVSPRMEEAHYRLAQVYKRTGEELKARKELDLYDHLSKQSAEETARERSEIQQFVVELRSQRAP
jgi:tetratricopeptide (TPR) repeat protein